MLKIIKNSKIFKNNYKDYHADYLSNSLTKQLPNCL